jgi:hypothetical protein
MESARGAKSAAIATHATDMLDVTVRTAFQVFQGTS